LQITTCCKKDTQAWSIFSVYPDQNILTYEARNHLVHSLKLPWDQLNDLLVAGAVNYS